MVRAIKFIILFSLIFSVGCGASDNKRNAVDLSGAEYFSYQEKMTSFGSSYDFVFYDNQGTEIYRKNIFTRYDIASPKLIYNEGLYLMSAFGGLVSLNVHDKTVNVLERKKSIFVVAADNNVVYGAVSNGGKTPDDITSTVVKYENGERENLFDVPYSVCDMAVKDDKIWISEMPDYKTNEALLECRDLNGELISSKNQAGYWNLKEVNGELYENNERQAVRLSDFEVIDFPEEQWDPFVHFYVDDEDGVSVLSWDLDKYTCYLYNENGKSEYEMCRGFSAYSEKDVLIEIEDDVYYDLDITTGEISRTPLSDEGADGIHILKFE